MSVPESKSPTQGSNVQLSPEQEGRAGVGWCGVVWGDSHPEGANPTGLLQDTTRFQQHPALLPRYPVQGTLECKTGNGHVSVSPCPC